jgi:hypothetical protein
LATITAPVLGIFSAPIQVRLVIKLIIGINIDEQILNVVFVPSGLPDGGAYETRSLAMYKS